MSVLYPADRGEWWAPETNTCHLCGEMIPADLPAVMWSCPTALLFHIDCAAYLGPHLIADSREARLASGQQPWTRRAALTLRSATTAEEMRR